MKDEHVKCNCSVNMAAGSGFSFDSTITWSRLIVLIINPVAGGVWELRYQ